MEAIRLLTPGTEVKAIGTQRPNPFVFFAYFNAWLIKGGRSWDPLVLLPFVGTWVACALNMMRVDGFILLNTERLGQIN